MADDVEKYDGEWKDGKHHGKGIYTWPDGHEYNGEWEEGKEHGMGTFTSPFGFKYVGELKFTHYYTYPSPYTINNGCYIYKKIGY